MTYQKISAGEFQQSFVCASKAWAEKAGPQWSGAWQDLEPQEPQPGWSSIMWSFECVWGRTPSVSGKSETPNDQKDGFLFFDASLSTLTLHRQVGVWMWLNVQLNRFLITSIPENYAWGWNSLWTSYISISFCQLFGHYLPTQSVSTSSYWERHAQILLLRYASGCISEGKSCCHTFTTEIFFFLSSGSVSCCTWITSGNTTMAAMSAIGLWIVGAHAVAMICHDAYVRFPDSGNCWAPGFCREKVKKFKCQNCNVVIHKRWTL